MTSQHPDGPGDLRERPLGELLRQLSEETTRLVHQELELAKAELTQKGRQAGVGAGLFGAAGATGLLAAAALTACFILLLDVVVPAWLAALVVAVAYAAVAAVLALRGRDRVKQAVPPVPEQAIETVKEDVQWARNQARSAKG
jgi:hypothetical protein